MSDAARRQLERWARSSTLPHRQVRRSQILLRLADGEPGAVIARSLGVSRDTVRRWRDRMLREGVETLLRDRPGRGRRPGRAADVVARVLETLGRHPSWSLRAVAAHVGTSAATVQRVRREHADEPVMTRQLMKRHRGAEGADGGKTLASAPHGHVSLHL